MIKFYKKDNNISSINYCLCVFALFFLNNAVAQVKNNGILHIGSNATFYVGSGAFSTNDTSLAVPSTSYGSTYNAAHGKLMLGSSATFTLSGTLPGINGYVGTYSTSETILPTGAVSGDIRPVVVLAATNTAGVHARYANQSPLTAFAGGLDASVVQVVDVDYWIVKGSNAKLTLTWVPTTGIANASIPIYALTIVGYKNGKWEAINSTVDATAKHYGGASEVSSTGKGSITTVSEINLSEYDAFAFGKKGVDCAPLVAASGATRTWNGSSWDVVPTLADAVTLNAAYNGGSFVCNSLNFNGFDVTLTGTQSLEIVNGVSGTGKIIMSSESSFVQRNASATAPAIELTKTTRPIKRYDYVYMGQPISGNAFSQLSGAVSGSNPADAFSYKFKYVSGNTTTTGGWQPLTATTPGQGFALRVKEQAPFVDATTAATIDLKFTGTANNGDVTAPIAKVAGDDTSSRNNNLLANPYPSAIDADKFLMENSAILDGVIYLWKAQTTNTDGATAYAVADYIAYTKAGSTAYSGTTTTGFDGKIASGQGFKVKALADGTAKFTNCMRVAGTNSQFFRINNYASRSESDAPVDRFNLNLQTENGIANQILVAYLPQTTVNYDKMYDATLLTTSGTNVFSILDNSSQKLAINARPDFTDTDEVALGFVKEETVPAALSIDVANREGIFNNNQTPIFLYDKKLNTYHNFANGKYTFTSISNTDTDRFKIVYKANTVPTDINDTFMAAYISDNKIHFNSSKEMVAIEIFDITGRLIVSYKANNQKVIEEFFSYPSAIFIAKTTFTDGTIATNKLLNK